MIKIRVFLKNSAPVLVVPDKEMLEKIGNKFRYEILDRNASIDLDALARTICEKEFKNACKINRA